MSASAAIAKMTPTAFLGVKVSWLSKIKEIVIGIARDILLAMEVTPIPDFNVLNPIRRKVRINKMPTITAAVTKLKVKKKPPE